MRLSKDNPYLSAISFAYDLPSGFALCILKEREPSSIPATRVSTRTPPDAFERSFISGKLVLDEPIKACGGYKIKAKLGYEVVGTVNVMVVEA